MEKLVYEILGEFCDIKETKINQNMTLGEDLGLNSLERIELIVKFEDKLEIEISDREISGLNKVSDIIEYLNGL